MATPKRHFIVPDVQARPGVPLDFIDWIAASIVHYKPDTVICLGDWWDFPSLSGHELPGSAPLEGRRYADDLAVGNEAFARLCAPMEAEIKRREDKHRKRWSPRKVFIMGNHENRADRAADANPKFIGTIGSDHCDTRDWERHPFLKVVNIDGVLYSHYFQSSHSARPIGGSIPNKLSKIGASFVHGHVQGLDMGTKPMANGKTWWGIQAGSCYTHIEPYRGAQGQRHWRGVIVLNEVEDGEFCPMPLTLNYLARKYEGMDLAPFHRLKYPNGSWDHLE
jgi:hypothetical protein